MQHEAFIRHCYDLAVSAGKKGFDTFGALLVHDGKVIETAENTADYARGLFGHAEFNLVHRCANRYSDDILREATLYTSCAPCERCLCAIASLGVRRVVYGVSWKEFSRLTPFDAPAIDREALLRQLGIEMHLTGPVLEEEGMHVFEWWGGEYRPLAELIAEMDAIRTRMKAEAIAGLDYAAVFDSLKPGFFQAEHIRTLPPEEVYAEQVLALADVDPGAPAVPAPQNIRYGLYTGDFAALQQAVRQVQESWVPFFHPEDRVFAATLDGQVLSFCLLEDFGEYAGLHIGGPGCVGTVPAFRRQGIGLRMIQLATAWLKVSGYDLSWIHYTDVGHWYARLGYKTVVRWNGQGLLSP